MAARRPTWHARAGWALLSIDGQNAVRGAPLCCAACQRLELPSACSCASTLRPVAAILGCCLCAEVLNGGQACARRAFTRAGPLNPSSRCILPFMHPFVQSFLRAEVLGVPEEDFHTAVDLGDTYPPTVFLDMLRDSSEGCNRGGELGRFGLPKSWLPDSRLLGSVPSAVNSKPAAVSATLG